MNRLKYFLTGSFLTIIILIGIFGYRQSIFSNETLPYDDEQKDLNRQITIHFSHVVAENTPKGMAAEKFAQLVEEKSNGRIIVQVYPNGMLYNDETEFEALQDGEIQMIAPTNSKMTSLLPDWQILDLPYLIETQDQLKNVLHGDLSQKLLGELESIDVKGLTFWSNGFKQIAASSSPIIEVEQFQNKRIRMMPSDILRKQFTLLGAEPVTISFSDVFYELQNNLVDAQENTISNIYSKQFHTMENHITLSNHGILCYAVMINEQFWNDLDPEAQHIIVDSLDEMKVWQHELAIELNENDLKSLSEYENVTLNELDETNKKEWKEKLEPLYDYYSSNINEEYFTELLQEVKK